MNVREQHIGEIPILICSDESVTPRPVVIALHGLTEQKEDMTDCCATLGQAGFVAVAVDARLHGERRATDLHERFAPEHFADSMFTTVSCTVG